MFEVSWGELGVMVGLGLALIGRKDLPRAARAAGTQVGRVVGLLQGARARADRFAAQNELSQLQNELRSGLRELDAVKSELAVSMTGRGMMGRTLGATVASANRPQQAAAAAKTTPTGQQFSNIEPTSTSSVSPNDKDDDYKSPATTTTLPPVSQTIAAVAEEEWEKQGIAFSSKAEQGVGLGLGYDQSTSGSALLANMMTQSLIFDQYDRTMQQQDAALQSKVESIRKKQHNQSKQRSETSKENDRNKTRD